MDPKPKVHVLLSIAMRQPPPLHLPPARLDLRLPPHLLETHRVKPLWILEQAAIKVHGVQRRGDACASRQDCAVREGKVGSHIAGECEESIGMGALGFFDDAVHLRQLHQAWFGDDAISSGEHRLPFGAQGLDAGWVGADVEEDVC